MEKRELKFRAWNGDTMNYNIVVGKFGAFGVNPGENNDGLDKYDMASLTPYNTKCTDETIIMQFTGLKDVNDKDIYEGDILQFEDEQKSVVKWLQGGLTCEANFGDYDLTTVGWAIEMLGCCEIIGNIYENLDGFAETGGKN